MTFNFFQKNFTERALIAGYSQENIDRCLNYARPLIEKDLPVIFNTSNLAALVGYNKSYIKRAAFFTKYFYREFNIKKKNGSLRLIKEPLPSLKEIQLWILENILSKLSISRYAKAYIKGRNILENVKYHKDRDIVLALDISNFFPSIKLHCVESIFKRVGYSDAIANLLAKICCNEDMLPQGAPTSPALSNVYMYSFDENVSKFCNEKNIRYTRYADDLSFSFNTNQDPLDIVLFIEQELNKLGLEINSTKSKILKKNQRQIITGVVVNEKVQLPREKRKKIRQEVYYVKKFGLSEHLKKTNNIKANYLQHLEGKINYALYINPNDLEMKTLKLYIQSLHESSSSI